MTGVEIVSWPSITDVVRQVGLSNARIRQLIAAGRLRAVNTRIGYLVDPESVAALQAARAAHPTRSGRGS